MCAFVFVRSCVRACYELMCVCLSIDAHVCACMFVPDASETEEKKSEPSKHKKKSKKKKGGWAVNMFVSVCASECVCVCVCVFGWDVQA